MSRWFREPTRSIESAISRPYSGYYRPLYRKVAALIQSIAGNHGFVDGNKRTALILAYKLVEDSGHQIVHRSTNVNEDDVEHLILDLTTHCLDFEEISRWLKSQIKPLK